MVKLRPRAGIDNHWEFHRRELQGFMGKRLAESNRFTD